MFLFTRIIVKNTRHSCGYACVFCLESDKNIPYYFRPFHRSNWYNFKGAGLKPASFFNAIFIMAFLSMVSCQSDDDPSKGNAVAVVFENRLYDGEILEALPKGLNETDSLEFVKNYIDTWIKENILLHSAESELSERAKDMETRIEKYRRSLLIYEYEKQYVEDHLDTNVSAKEMEKHYNENKQNFELKDYIIKGVYVKLEKSIPGKENVLKWIKSGKKDELLKLEEFCRVNAVSFYHDRDNWIFLNDILRDVPLEIPNKESFLKSNKLVQFEDEEYFYVLQILDFRMKAETSPLSLEKDNIKARILQSRMNELIKTMRNNLVKKAYQEDEVKIIK
jgi:hypothetical protein